MNDQLTLDSATATATAISQPEEGDGNGMRRTFVHFAEAWYAEAHRRQGCHPDRREDEVHVHLYDEAAGIDSTFTIEWVVLNDRVVPRLMAFDDGWAALYLMGPDLYEFLVSHHRDGGSRARPLSPAQFCAWLLKQGFTDATERERDTNE